MYFEGSKTYPSWLPLMILYTAFKYGVFPMSPICHAVLNTNMLAHTEDLSL